MDRLVDVGLVGEWLVPRRGGVLAALPRGAGEALDRLQRDALLGTQDGELVERLRVARVLHLHEVVRAQHRVEVEALQAALVHLRDAEAVAGDADVVDQALLPRLDARFECAARAQRRVPLDHVAQVVQLDRVHVVDPEPLERAPDLLPRRGVRALARLGRDEERVLLEPRRDPQLRVAVARGDVDVVDAVLEEQLQRAVGVGLGDVAERRGTEDHAAGLVSGRAEGGAVDHAPELTRLRKTPLQSSPGKRASWIGL